jgi:hypothetical protein
MQGIRVNPNAVNLVHVGLGALWRLAERDAFFTDLLPVRCYIVLLCHFALCPRSIVRGGDVVLLRQLRFSLVRGYWWPITQLAQESGMQPSPSCDFVYPAA